MRNFRFSFWSRKSGNASGKSGNGGAGRGRSGRGSVGGFRRLLRRRLLCESLESRQLLSITSLEWVPVEGADYYVVERSDAGTDAWTTVGSSAGNSYTDTGLPDGITADTYDYRVSAMIGNECTEISDVQETVRATDRMTVADVEVAENVQSVTFRFSEPFDSDSFFIGTNGLLTLVAGDGAIVRIPESEITLAIDRRSITWTPTAPLTEGAYTLYLESTRVDRSSGPGSLVGGVSGLLNAPGDLTRLPTSLKLLDEAGGAVHPTAVMLTDWDGDGRGDLLVALTDTVDGETVGIICVYPNSGTADSPEFLPENAYWLQFGSGLLTVDGKITGIALADSNDDGRDDLWVTLSDGSIEVFRVNPHAIGLVPEFASKTTISAGKSIGDHVVTSLANNTLLFAGNESGGVHCIGYDDGVWTTQPLYVDGQAIVIGSGAVTPIVMDLNDDGEDDLLVVDENGFVWYLANVGWDMPPGYLLTETSYNFLPPVLLHSNGEPIRLAENFTALTTRDTDGDGLRGLIVSYADGSVVMYENPGARPAQDMGFISWDGNPHELYNNFDYGRYEYFRYTFLVEKATESTPLVAVDDEYTLDQDTFGVFDVLANDTVSEGGELTIIGVSTPSHGVAEIVDGKVVYTPESGWFGVDTFAYMISDGESESTATVTVTVVETSQPVDITEANGDRYTLDQDTFGVFDVLANDTVSEGGELTIIGVSTPSHGVAEIADGKVVYTPESGWFGVDVFTYTIRDGLDGESTATVTVTVSSLFVTIDVDRAMVPQGGSVTYTAVVDTDADPENLTYRWYFAGSPATTLGIGETLTLTYDAATYPTGTYTVVVEVTDHTDPEQLESTMYQTVTQVAAAINATLDVETSVTPPGIYSVRETLTFTVSPVGGSGGYTYTWKLFVQDQDGEWLEVTGDEHYPEFTVPENDDGSVVTLWFGGEQYGHYRVECVVTDAEDPETFAEKVVTTSLLDVVAVDAKIAGPVRTFNATDTLAEFAVTVSVNGVFGSETQADVSDDGWQIEWDFGDGRGWQDYTDRAHSLTPEYQYTDPIQGCVVKVRITDPEGRVAEDVWQPFDVVFDGQGVWTDVTVEIVQSELTDEGTLKEGGTTTFIAMIRDNVTGDILSGDDLNGVTYEWTFSNGQTYTANGNEATVVWRNDGTYAVGVKVMKTIDDEELERQGTIADVVVRNVLPEITSVTMPEWIPTGANVTMVATTGTDPGVEDIVYLYWYTNDPRLGGHTSGYRQSSPGTGVSFNFDQAGQQKIWIVVSNGNPSNANFLADAEIREYTIFVDTVTLTGPNRAVEGIPATFTGSFTINGVTYTADTLPDGYTITWDFGDYTTDTASNNKLVGRHTYTEADEDPCTVTMTLRYRDPNHPDAAEVVVTRTVQVMVVVAESGFPICGDTIEVSPGKVVAGQEATFTGTFTVDGVAITSSSEIFSDYVITWDFGDGTTNTSDTLTPKHTFSEAGTYTVKMTVGLKKSGGGTEEGSEDFSTVTITVRVEGTPIATITPPTGTAIEGKKKTFAGSFTVGDTTYTTSSEDLGDYVVRWYFDGSTTPVSGTGNGLTSPEYTFHGDTYTVRMEVIYAPGGVESATLRDSDTIAGKVYSVVTPVCGDVTYTPELVDEGVEVTFAGAFEVDGQTITASDPLFDDYTIVWDFGDGTTDTSNTLAPKHTYNKAGSYTVTMKVTHRTDTAATSTSPAVTVTVSPDLLKLGVELSEEVVLSQPAYLTITPPEGYTGTTWTVMVNWGDGSEVETVEATGETVVWHLYSKLGNYTVQLIVGTKGSDVTLELADRTVTVKHGTATGIDPFNPNATSTFISLSDSETRMMIQQNRATGELRAIYGDGRVEILQTPTNGGGLYIYASDNPTRVILTQYVTVDATIVGGAGDNYFVGGAGTNYLFGGAGNDALYSGWNGKGSVLVGQGGDDLLVANATSRNVLVSGDGSDTLVSSSGDDLLIADQTIWDGTYGEDATGAANLAAYRAIYNAWNSNASLAARQAALRGGVDGVGGDESKYQLQVGTTIFGDGKPDRIVYGNVGNSWLIRMDGEWYDFGYGGGYGNTNDEDTQDPSQVGDVTVTLGTLVGVTTGEEVAFAYNATGGSGNYTYTWSIKGKNEADSAYETITVTNGKYTFTAAGEYTIRVEATDSSGKKNTATQNYVVKSVPVVELVLPESVKANAAADFVIRVTQDGETYTYTPAGDSPVTALPSGWKIEWDFTGNGTTDRTLTNPASLMTNYTYAEGGSYAVKVKVTDDEGRVSTTVSETLQVANSLVVLTPNELTGIVTGQEVSIVAAPSSIADGEQSYKWYVTEGTARYSESDTPVSTSATLKRTFSTSGTYTIWLKVTQTGEDDEITTEEISRTITVKAIPEVTFSDTSDDVVGTGRAANFTATLSQDGTAVTSLTGWTLTWNFGDSSTNTTGTLTEGHTYTTAGTYTVTLIARDNEGRESVAATWIVHVVDAIVVSEGWGTPTSPAIPDEDATFTATATGGTPGGNLIYTWYFDETTAGNPETAATSKNATATTGNPASITWNTMMPGNHTVRLVVMDEESGLVLETTTTTFGVHTVPEVTGVAGSISSPERGDTVSYTGTVIRDENESPSYTTSQLPSGWTAMWTFVDPDDVETTNTTGVYRHVQAGSYTVRLVVKDNDGRESEAFTKTVTVFGVGAGLVQDREEGPGGEFTPVIYPDGPADFTGTIRLSGIDPSQVESITYEWYVDGVLLEGESGTITDVISAETVIPIQLTFAAGQHTLQYKVVVTLTDGTTSYSVESDRLTVSVYDDPELSMFMKPSVTVASNGNSATANFGVTVQRNGQTINASQFGSGAADWKIEWWFGDEIDPETGEYGYWEDVAPGLTGALTPSHTYQRLDTRLTNDDGESGVDNYGDTYGVFDIVVRITDSDGRVYVYDFSMVDEEAGLQDPIVYINQLHLSSDVHVVYYEGVDDQDRPVYVVGATVTPELYGNLTGESETYTWKVDGKTINPPSGEIWGPDFTYEGFVGASSFGTHQITCTISMRDENNKTWTDTLTFDVVIKADPEVTMTPSVETVSSGGSVTCSLTLSQQEVSGKQTYTNLPDGWRVDWYVGNDSLPTVTTTSESESPLVQSFTLSELGANRIRVVVTDGAGRTGITFVTVMVTGVEVAFDTSEVATTDELYECGATLTNRSGETLKGQWYLTSADATDYTLGTLIDSEGAMIADGEAATVAGSVTLSEAGSYKIWFVLFGADGEGEYTEEYQVGGPMTVVAASAPVVTMAPPSFLLAGDGSFADYFDVEISQETAGGTKSGGLGTLTENGWTATWTFGSDTTATPEGYGIQTVTLKVIDADGRIGTSMHSVEVISIEGVDRTGVAGAMIPVSATIGCSASEAINALEYEWIVCDDEGVLAMLPAEVLGSGEIRMVLVDGYEDGYTFDVPGEYTVSLVVKGTSIGKLVSTITVTGPIGD